MGKLQNYVPNQFGQINLEDGSRILVSLTQSEIKVFQLGFFGFPKRTLHTFDELSLNRMRTFHGDALEFVFSQLLIKETDVEGIADACALIEDDLQSLFQKK